MPAKDDIGFTFDPKPFQNALGKIDSGLTKTAKAAKSAGDNIGKSMTWAVAKGQLLASGITSLAKSFKGVINEQIPEIGQAFGIAKEIIFKNIFWPIRQQIVPLLQKMLDWVRDNRAMFLKFGETLVGVFRTGWTVAKTFINALSPVWDAVKKLLGLTKGDWMDQINIIMAKVATVAIYLGMVLQKPIALIADMIKSIGDSGLLNSIIDFAMTLGKVAWNVITSFFSGLAEWVKPAATAISGIVKSLDNIFKIVFGGDGGGLNGFFKFLGTATGWTISTLLEGLNLALQGITVAIGWIREAIEDVRHFMAGLPGGLFSAMEVKIPYAEAAQRIKGGEAVGHFVGLGMDEKRLNREVSSIKDGVVQNGKAVNTDPRDVIIAHKGQVSVNKSSGAGGIGTWTVNLSVTEGGARQAGSNFAEGMQYQIRSLMASEAMTGGR